MKRLLLLLVLALVPSLAVAQQAAAQTAIIIGPNSSLKLDINTPDAATAQAGAYRVAVDAAASVPLTSVVCALNGNVAPASLVTCSVPVAQIPTGTHTVVVSGTLASGASATAPAFSYLTVTLLINNVRVQ